MNIVAKRADDTLPGRAPDEATVQDWLVARVAVFLDQPKSEIDVTLPFSSYALNSITTVGLTGELEDLLEMKLPATLIWDYPSIELLARHLAARDRE
jgi:acyl carrier protein